MTGFRMIIPLAILAFVLTTAGDVVLGYSSYVSRIPNGDVFGCENCHYPTTNFLSDFDDAGREWSVSLATEDSDGDGWTNGEELQDPTGSWSEGQPDPGNPDLVTNPGQASSHPEPSATPSLPTATPTPTPTPLPSATPIPTETAIPTATLAPTEPPETPFPTATVSPFSPTPTNSPAPSPTVTATPVATATSTMTPPPTATEEPFSPTPAEATETPLPSPTAFPEGLTVGLELNQSAFHTGDVFSLTTWIVNGGDPTEVNEFLILEVFGQYYFAPSWTENLDYVPRQLPTRFEERIEALAFQWPSGVGAIPEARFWYALLEPNNTELATDYDVVTWSFEP